MDSALSLLLEAGESFDYAEVGDLAEPKVPEAPALTLSGKPDLKSTTACSRSAWPRRGCAHDTDTSVMQDRIGQLCGQFKLPTVGPSRWPVSPPLDTATPWQLSWRSWKQEAEDRRHRRINRLRRESRLPSGKTWEPPSSRGQALRAQPSPPGAVAATGPPGPGQIRRAWRQRAGLRTARHRQDPRPVHHRPPPGGSRPS